MSAARLRRVRPRLPLEGEFLTSLRLPFKLPNSASKGRLTKRNIKYVELSRLAAVWTTPPRALALI
jgi:hypothetical protein